LIGDGRRAGSESSAFAEECWNVLQILPAGGFA